ncbi:hypothetical protein STEG23_016934, partial [Scotinomys teguina]
GEKEKSNGGWELVDSGRFISDAQLVHFSAALFQDYAFHSHRGFGKLSHTVIKLWPPQSVMEFSFIIERESTVDDNNAFNKAISSKHI